MDFTYEELNNDEEKRRQYIMNDIQSKLDWLKLNTNHDIIYIGLQGSQNYLLDVYTDEYKSDIDVKAICVPSFEDIVRGEKMFSHTYIMDDNSHIDVKDIRLYVDLWKKSNPSFLEILFTEFNIILNDRFKNVLAMADDIAGANTDRVLSAIKGMQIDKYKALKHPYPACIDEIKDHGYCRKQMHHLYRLSIFGDDICSGKSFRDSLVISDDDQREITLNYKTKVYPIDYIDEASSFYVGLLQHTVSCYRETHKLTVNTEIYDKLENIVYDIIIEKCKAELTK